MDSVQEALDYDAMDHAHVNRAFAEDFLSAFIDDVPPINDDESWLELLDLGTGTAQIPIEICRREPRVRVLAVDLATSMLHLAGGNVEVAGLVDRIRLDRVDAKQLPYESGRFAAVISNSIVHHIPEPKGALAEASRATASGGLIFIRDLLRPTDDTTVRQLVETYAAGANDHQRQMFDDSLRAALNLDEIRAMVRALGYDVNTVQQSSDRHWTWIARKNKSVERLA
jgi:ubiquinone/menaquinone biosynthesis C-methylase UbiE